MRKVLLGLLLLPFAAGAQNFELGLRAGISTNTKPSDNMVFKGDKMTLNYAAAVDVVYNLSERWQAGVEIQSTQLSMKSDKAYTYWNGAPIGNDNKRFIYAKNAGSLAAVFNAKLPTMNGYAFGGLALGYAAARHDSKDLSDNESYRAPNGGNGVVFGLQAGYVMGLTTRLGFIAQAAFRYYNFKYDALQPNGSGGQENLKYGIVSIPVTVGLRFRIKGGKDDLEKERQDLMNVGMR